MGMILLCASAVANGGAAGGTEVAIDPGKTGAAISPYLYGQFIEHLGRCIRDGIWAEKLKDRKFLLESGKSWEVQTLKGTPFDVFHDPAGAYAGDHCMALWLHDSPGIPAVYGIRQSGIGLIAGKEYVGYAMLANVGKPAPVQIVLQWGQGAADCQWVMLDKVGREYRKFPFRFRAGATTDSGSLSLRLTAECYLWVACLSLMPADNVKGMRADTLELVKKLNSPIIRWPGGNFVSGYNWKDAIGDRDRRPPRWERAWNDVEDNDFGLDEFMVFCKEVNTEPYVAVNTGLGSVADAADEVEYANGSAQTRWGAERAKNGHTAPYDIVWWGIGNEMYGGWQLGNVSVERYALRHNAFVDAMRASDPRIKVIAVGAPGGWNDKIVPLCAAHMDLLSGHHYTERKLKLPFSPEDLKKCEEGFVAYSGHVAGGVRGLVADFRKRLGKGDAAVDRVRLAVDEWGIVREWNPAPDPPGVGAFEHYYTLADAIAIARAMQELLRSADVVAMANWAQTVNVIATIKTSRNHACLDPAGHVLALYRAHLLGELVPVTVGGDATVDAVATLDKKAGVLAIGLINFSPNQEAAVTLRFPAGFQGSAATGWRINGPNLGATNAPGQPEVVTTAPLPDGVKLDGQIVLPAHSITVLTARIEAR